MPQRPHAVENWKTCHLIDGFYPIPKKFSLEIIIRNDMAGCICKLGSLKHHGWLSFSWLKRPWKINQNTVSSIYWNCVPCFPYVFRCFPSISNTWLRIEKIPANHQAVTRSVVVLAKSASTERKTTSKALVQPSTKKDKLINWAPLHQHGRTEWHSPKKIHTIE